MVNKSFIRSSISAITFNVLIISVLLIGSHNTFAAPINLNQLIKIAVDNNPQLKVQKLEWQSLIHQYKQATSLSDPILIYSESLSPIETRLGPQDRVLALNQKLPYRGKLALKGEVVKKNIEMAKVNYDKASRDLTVSLKQTFYELVYLENAIKLTVQNKQLLEKVNQAATADYASNAAALNDVAKAQSQYAQVAYDVTLLKELRSTEKTRINTLLNRPPEFAFEVNSNSRTPTAFTYDIAKLYQWAESNEEITLADIAIQKSIVQSQLSSYASKPDFTLGARYSQIGTRDVPDLRDNGRDAFSINLSMSIPLNRGKNNAIKEQARLQHLKQLENKKVMQNQLRNAVKGYYFKLNNAYRQTVLYKNNLLPQANRAAQVAHLHYRENKGSIGQYLETQSTWLNFQLAHQRAVANYWSNLTQMEKLTGKKL
ncbi:MAG: cobalt-zinc-cadmium efflux system outer membrane protein [Cocleimonas sp.]|jgi:cobalt-zinc-cadmium efflux system outer membrane protein